jgi:hypothetical protein
MLMERETHHNGLHDWNRKCGPSTGTKSNVGGTGCPIDEAPEDLPCRKAKGVIIAQIRICPHQPDEADVPVISSGKHAVKRRLVTSSLSPDVSVLAKAPC